MPRTIISLFLAVENGRWTPARDFMSYILIPFATALDFYNRSRRNDYVSFTWKRWHVRPKASAAFSHVPSVSWHVSHGSSSTSVLFCFHKNRELSRLNENRLINIVSVHVARYTGSFPFSSSFSRPDKSKIRTDSRTILEATSRELFTYRQVISRDISIRVKSVGNKQQSLTTFHVSSRVSACHNFTLSPHRSREHKDWKIFISISKIVHSYWWNARSIFSLTKWLQIFSLDLHVRMKDTSPIERGKEAWNFILNKERCAIKWFPTYNANTNT